MFTSILNSSTSSLTVSDAIICSLASLAIGLIIAFSYMLCGKFTKNFVISLVLLPVIVQIVIMMVNGNLGTGVAVLGAFSLVRFRSVPGSAKDICNIFFAMAAGLATGMGYVTFALTFAVFVCGIFFVLAKTKFGEPKQSSKTLKVTIPENLDYNEIFEDLFAKYTTSCSLERVKTTNLGSMYELNYAINLKDINDEKEFIDEIRCRNGNLTIICSREQIIADQL